MSMPTKYYSELQENRIAGYLGWHTVVGSGATATKPGDVFSDQWLGECKTHTKKTDKITFKLSHWEKIRKEAQSKFKFPVLFTDDGTQDIHNTWCLIDCSVSCPTETTLLKVPYKKGANLNFDITKLKSYYHGVSDSCRILYIETEDSKWGVLPISEFYRYFI